MYSLAPFSQRNYAAVYIRSLFLLQSLLHHRLAYSLCLHIRTAVFFICVCVTGV
jgi:hypothetical protein